MSHVSTGHPAGPSLACPTCGRVGTPVLFGLPTPSADEAAAAGQLILRGCVEPEDHPHWECAEGHEWSGDEAEWSAALNAVIGGRPHCRVCGGPTRYLVYPGAEEVFLEELASGEAEMAPGPSSSGDHFRRICRSCRAIA